MSQYSRRMFFSTDVSWLLPHDLIPPRYHGSPPTLPTSAHYVLSCHGGALGLGSAGCATKGIRIPAWFVFSGTDFECSNIPHRSPFAAPAYTAFGVFNFYGCLFLQACYYYCRRNSVDGQQRFPISPVSRGRRAANRHVQAYASSQDR